MFNDYPDILTINDITKILHIGKNTAYKLVNDKTIKSIRIGRSYKIPKCYVIEYLHSVGYNYAHQ